MAAVFEDLEPDARQDTRERCSVTRREEAIVLTPDREDRYVECRETLVERLESPAVVEELRERMTGDALRARIGMAARELLDRFVIDARRIEKRRRIERARHRL